MKIAIVTGASSGIGKEFVKQIAGFYKDLDEIWVLARREEVLEQLKKKSPVYIRVFAGDLTKELVYKQVKNRLENQNPDVRMLVNAAGFGKFGTIEGIARHEENLQTEMIDLNCRSLTKLTCLCLPYMRKGSRIVNIASAAAFCPQSGFAVYAASKAYVLSFSRALRAELHPRGIYVTAVCPGPVDTEFFDRAGVKGHGVRRMVRAKTNAVVRQALEDVKNKKEISVYGKLMKGARVAAKMIPHRWLVSIMNMV